MVNNLLQLRYAVEVEKTGSISKAAENLFMGQPHLSKAIRELEDSLGLAIFSRSARGVVPTQKGREFLLRAKDILRRADELEALYDPSRREAQRFDVSVPRASYVSYAFAQYAKRLNFAREVDLDYRETNSVQAMGNVADGTNNIAVIRYQASYERFFLNALEEKELACEHVCEFSYGVLMSRRHPLADRTPLTPADLDAFTQIMHGDIAVPGLPPSQTRAMAQQGERARKIVVYERGSQMELLERVPETFMWVSPMPRDVLERFGLALRKCDAPGNLHRDVLIYRKGYRLTQDDAAFAQILRDCVKAMASPS